MTMPRAVLIVLDGMPNRHVNERTTPHLMRLGSQGGRAPDGGRAVMTSATYPNHATLVTGVDPAAHGLTANFVVRDDAIVAAETVGPAVRTVFDLDGETAAAYGDQNLVGVTGARSATMHWPPDGVVPDDVVRTTDGYIADEATVVQVCAALASEAAVVVAQLNGPDTAGHLYGPDASEAADAYHSTDECLGVIVEALRPRWDDTFLAVVSDHDQVTVTDPHCIDLWSPMREQELSLTVVPEGEAAIITGTDPTDGGWLAAINGIAGHRRWYDGTRLVWAKPGRVFGWGETTMRGIHGGPGSRTQVAVVAGGHPLVSTVAARIAAQPPDATAWAPLLAKAVGQTLQGR